jgi:peroxin-7
LGCEKYGSIFIVVLIMFLGPQSVQTIRAHEHEILTCDWNKYNEFILISGSVDKTIKIWDVRNTTREVGTLKGHSYAVRRVKCSPHGENILASCS